MGGAETARRSPVRRAVPLAANACHIWVPLAALLSARDQLVLRGAGPPQFASLHGPAHHLYGTYGKYGEYGEYRTYVSMVSMVSITW